VQRLHRILVVAGNLERGMITGIDAEPILGPVDTSILATKPEGFVSPVLG